MATKEGSLLKLKSSGIQSIPGGWRYQVAATLWTALVRSPHCSSATMAGEAIGTDMPILRMEVGEDLAVAQDDHTELYQYKTGGGESSQWTISTYVEEVLYHFAKTWLDAGTPGIRFHFVTDKVPKSLVALQDLTRRLRQNAGYDDLTFRSPEDSRRFSRGATFVSDLAVALLELGKEHKSSVAQITPNDVVELLKITDIHPALTEEDAISEATSLLVRYVPMNIARDKIRALLDETFTRLCEDSSEFTAFRLLHSVGIAGSISWADISSYCAEQRQDRVSRMVNQHALLEPSRMIPRSAAEATFEQFLIGRKPILLFSGRQGRGKTSLIIRLAEKSGKLTPTYLTKAGDLDLDVLARGILARFDHEPSCMSLPQLLRRANLDGATGCRLLIFCDGADEIDDRTLRSILHSIAELMASNLDLPIRFCFTTRQEAWETSTQRVLSEFKHLFHPLSPEASTGVSAALLDDFAEDELQQALQEWQIGDDAIGPWRPILMVPRHFALYVGLSQQSKEAIACAVPRPAALFERYLDDRLDDVERRTKLRKTMLRDRLVKLCIVFRDHSTDGMSVSVEEFENTTLAKDWDYDSTEPSTLYNAFKLAGLLQDEDGTVRIVPEELACYLQAISRVDELLALPGDEERIQRIDELVPPLDPFASSAVFVQYALLIQLLEDREDLQGSYLHAVNRLLISAFLTPFFETVGPAAVRAIRELSEMGQGDPYTQTSALVTIGPSPESVQELLRRLTQDDQTTRIQACRALSFLGIQDAIKPIAEQYTHAGSAYEDHLVLECLSRYGEKTLDTLEGLLADSSANVVRAALGALSVIGHRRSLSPIRHIARCSDDGDLRRSALWALASLGDIESVDLFRSAIESSEEAFQRAGIAGFQETRDPSGVARLLSLLTNRETAGFAREEIVAALVAIGDDDAVGGLVDVLRADLRSPTPLFKDREWAWTAKRLPALQMVDLLIQAIADQKSWGVDGSRRDETIRALAQDARPEVTVRLQSLETTEDANWRQAEAVLRHVIETGSWRGFFVGDRHDDLECSCIVLAKAGSKRCSDALSSLLTRASADDSLALWAAQILRVQADRSLANIVHRRWAQLHAEPYSGPVIPQSSWLKHELGQSLGTCGDAAVLRSLTHELRPESNAAVQDGMIRAIGELAVGLDSPNIVFGPMMDSAADPDRLSLVNLVIRHSLDFTSVDWWHRSAAEYPQFPQLRDQLIAESNSGSAPALFAAAVVGLHEISSILHQRIREGTARQAYQAVEAACYLNDEEAIPHITQRIEHLRASGGKEDSANLLRLSLAAIVHLGGVVNIPDVQLNLLEGMSYVQAILTSGRAEDKARIASLLLSRHSQSFIDGEVSRAIAGLADACPQAVSAIEPSTQILKTWPEDYIASLVESWLKTGEASDAGKAVEMLLHVKSKTSRRDIALSINKSRSTLAQEALLALAGSRDSSARAIAAEALAWLDGDAPIAVLQSLSEDESGTVRRSAREALDQIARRASQRNLLSLTDWDAPRSALAICLTISDSMDDLIAGELLTDLYGRRDPIPYARAEYMLSRWRRSIDKRKSDERNFDNKQNWFQIRQT